MRKLFELTELAVDIALLTLAVSVGGMALVIWLVS
jgi:hypothetical protein